MGDLIVIYKGDEEFEREFELKNADGSPYDLTSHIARFKMVSDYGSTSTIDQPAEIVTPETDGKVRYKFSSTDTSTVGRYYAEVETEEITTGKILTWKIAAVEIRPTV